VGTAAAAGEREREGERVRRACGGGEGELDSLRALCCLFTAGLPLSLLRLRLRDGLRDGEEESLLRRLRWRRARLLLRAAEAAGDTEREGDRDGDEDELMLTLRAQGDNEAATPPATAV